MRLAGGLLMSEHMLAPILCLPAAGLAGEASALAEGALQLPALLDFPPSLVTAALLYVARRAAGTYPAWPPCLSTLTGVTALPGRQS